VFVVGEFNGFDNSLQFHSIVSGMPYFFF